MRLLYRQGQQPDPSEDPIAAVVDRLMQHPRAQEVLDNVSGKVDGFADFLGSILSGQRRPPKFHPNREPGQQPPRPPPRQPPPPRPAIDARAVMGFVPGQALTVAIVKKRYKELAFKHHPDRGGDAAKMSLVNRARDALLEEIGA